MTKDTSGHGHWDRTGLLSRKQAVDHDCGDFGQFPARMRQDLHSEIVFTRDNGGKERGEVGRRNRVGGAGQISGRAGMSHPRLCRELWQAGMKNVFGGSVISVESVIRSTARSTARTAARPIQWAEPSSPMANPQPPARAVWPWRSRP